MRCRCRDMRRWRTSIAQLLALKEKPASQAEETIELQPFHGVAARCLHSSRATSCCVMKTRSRRQSSGNAGEAARFTERPRCPQVAAPIEPPTRRGRRPKRGREPLLLGANCRFASLTLRCGVNLLLFIANRGCREVIMSKLTQGRFQPDSAHCTPTRYCFGACDTANESSQRDAADGHGFERKWFAT